MTDQSDPMVRVRGGDPILKHRKLKIVEVNCEHSQFMAGIA
jgi:hypothetical protein